MTPLSPEVISRQATINIGTIGHVAHGKSTVVKAISGVHTVRFKNELERNITIKLGKLCFKELLSYCIFYLLPECSESITTKSINEHFVYAIWNVLPLESTSNQLLVVCV